MSESYKPRLRHFEQKSTQQHVGEADHYLYKHDAPTHRFAIIGVGTIGKEYMRVATLLGRARIHGIYDPQERSLDVAESEFAKISSEKLVRYADLESACSDPERVTSRAPPTRSAIAPPPPWPPRPDIQKSPGTDLMAPATHEPLPPPPDPPARKWS